MIAVTLLILAARLFRAGDDGRLQRGRVYERTGTWMLILGLVIVAVAVPLMWSAMSAGAAAASAGETCSSLYRDADDAEVRRMAATCIVESAKSAGEASADLSVGIGLGVLGLAI